VTTVNGEKVILEARQAVILVSERAVTLLDPSAIAEINMDFNNSIGTCVIGRHAIDLKPCQGGVGFKSRKPTELERTTVDRLVISTKDYNKNVFMQKGLAPVIRKICE
jgi:hypothetical protein